MVNQHQDPFSVVRIHKMWSRPNCCCSIGRFALVDPLAENANSSGTCLLAAKRTRKSSSLALIFDLSSSSQKDKEILAKRTRNSSLLALVFVPSFPRTVEVRSEETSSYHVVPSRT